MKEDSKNDDKEFGLRFSKVKIAVGIGIFILIFILIHLITGGDYTKVFKTSQQIFLQHYNYIDATNDPISVKDEEMGIYVKATVIETNEVWYKLFEENGKTYTEPKLVFFNNTILTSSEGTNTASGSFYSPSEKKIYIDLAFLNELKKQNETKIGELAIKYVIAHEVGHHVLTLIENYEKSGQFQQNKSKTEVNNLKLKTELQTDFLAGLTTYYNQEFLDKADIEKALISVSSVGSDLNQKKSLNLVVPNSFTHGSEEQRLESFMKGNKTRDLNLDVILKNLD